MHFEKGDYDRCIEDCDAAVERGRELRADYKTIARALTRKGTSLVKQGKLEDAIDTYQKALTEHRCLQTLCTNMLAPTVDTAFSLNPSPTVANSEHDHLWRCFLLSGNEPQGFPSGSSTTCQTKQGIFAVWRLSACPC